MQKAAQQTRAGGAPEEARHPEGELRRGLVKHKAKAEIAALHFILETREGQERIFSQGAMQFVS